MTTQEPKQLIDVGEIGNASTGDILFDGGRKINSDFNQIYNTFGDQRLFENDEGDGTQVLHATGYYQKPTLIEWQAAVPLGALRDVDCSNGVIRCTLEKGKVGEGMVFINSNGSISTENYLEIQAIDSFVSVPTGTLKIVSPFTKVTVWCVDDSNGVSKWDYSIESMFGNKQTPLDKTYILGPTAREIKIVHRTEFSTLKLMMTAQSNDGRKYKASETMMYIDTVESKVYSTEYAVIRKGNVSEEDEIYDIAFTLGADGFVTATASSTTANLKFAIKVVDTQTFGVSQ